MRRSSFARVLSLTVIFLATTTGVYAAGGESAAPRLEAPSAKATEPQVMRTFHLENMALKDAMIMVRSLVGAKHVAASEALNGLVVRDTAGKVEVMEKLLATIDKPQAEVALDVDVLYLPGGRSGLAAGDSRLSAAELTSLRQSARSLMRQEISILENDTASWALKDQIVVHESYFDVGFELKAQPRVHAASDEVTLRLAFKLSDGEPGAGAVISNRDFESGTRLRSGETFLLSGLTVGTATGSQSSWLTSRFGLPAGPGEVILALTPRIIRGPGFTASDLATICVGTRNHVALCGQAELSKMLTSKVTTASLGSELAKDEEKNREAVRQRLRQRLRSLEAAAASDATGSTKE